MTPMKTVIYECAAPLRPGERFMAFLTQEAAIYVDGKKTGERGFSMLPVRFVSGTAGRCARQGLGVLGRGKGQGSGKDGRCREIASGQCRQTKDFRLMPHYPPKWTPAEDAILIAMLAKDKTYKEIGAAVGRKPDAVGGRIDRLRGNGVLPKPMAVVRETVARLRNGRGNTDHAAQMRLRRAAEGPPRAPVAPAASLAERFAEGYQGQRGRLSIIELTAGVCRFPVDQRKGPVRYCGDAVAAKSVYCGAHDQRCNNPR